jgi:regulator of protease activity HflC (stomatin/prohibitin superfamily)
MVSSASLEHQVFTESNTTNNIEEMANQYPNVSRLVSRTGLLLAAVIILFGIGGGCMTTTIGAGESGVKFSSFSGTDLAGTYGEGFHLHAPWSRIIAYDVRVKEQLEEINALSSNGLSIQMDISVRYHADATTLPALHTTYGVEYYRKLVQPELRSVAREVVGRYTPEELYSSKRTELQDAIEGGIREGVESDFVKLDAVLIRHVELPDQIKVAIENKLKEEQEAERYQYTIEKEKLEAERKKIEAEGEATYQRIITQSLSPAFLRFKGIEATIQLAESGNSKVVVICGGDDGLPLILGGQ